jgi:hypothetical protein
VHWNNAANEPWRTDALGRVSHIYRDQRFDIDRVLVGSLSARQMSARQIVIRGVGGTVGDYDVTYTDAASLQIGNSYLVFLREEDTPTREGEERSWTTCG